MPWTAANRDQGRTTTVPPDRTRSGARGSCRGAPWPSPPWWPENPWSRTTVSEIAVTGLGPSSSSGRFPFDLLPALKDGDSKSQYSGCLVVDTARKFGASASRCRSRWLVSNDRIWRPCANPTNRVARRWPHEPQNRSVDQIRSARERSLALSDERAAKDTAHLVQQPRY